MVSGLYSHLRIAGYHLLTSIRSRPEVNLRTTVTKQLPIMDTVRNAAQNFASTVSRTIDGATSGTTSNGEQTILVTGASGFVAAHVLNEFLDNGYRVRGTVRSEASAAKVRKTHAKYGDKLSFAIVEDVAAPGAFNEAVKGVNGVSVPTIMSVLSTCNEYRSSILPLPSRHPSRIMRRSFFNPRYRALRVYLPR